MTDTREAILARLVAVCEAVPGINVVRRNSKIADETEFPSVIIADADEIAEPPPSEGRRVPPGIQIVTMTPEIFVMLGSDADTVGTAINTLRAAVLKAIMTDDGLATITGSNGRIRYNSCATGLTQGRNMIADMGLSISFTYPLTFSAL